MAHWGKNLVTNLSLDVSTVAVSIPGVVFTVTASFCSRKSQSDENHIQVKIIPRELNTDVDTGRY